MNHGLLDLPRDAADYGADAITRCENKKLVQSAKEILGGFGYQVKVSHLHELLARLCGHRNLHTAKAAGVNFREGLTSRCAKNAKRSSSLDPKKAPESL